MNNISIPATSCTPEVEFDFDGCTLSLTGESYPENAAAFYRPLVTAVEGFVAAHAQRSGAVLALHVSLSYFNSSSTKMLFSLFGALNGADTAGIATTLHWYYDPEDDISEEFGQELSLDFPSITFHLHPGR
ncbi:DUF1987 domain-containing protein [Ewingella americana]